ncbi:hypothetical protein [Nonlabens sp. SY33080]|uniref:hypothetical protein n=1 Tax=Nonlabens sp. SY33080 TaxID=2719911 RepID=UPI001428A25D|nr:hypothetical protein [Nonlabens sp. SY33080]
MSELFHIHYLLKSLFVYPGASIILVIYLAEVYFKQKFSIAIQSLRWILILHVAFSWILFIYQLETGATTFWDRATDSYAGMYWWLLFCSLALPLFVLLPKLGKNKWVIALVCSLSAFGLWMERLVIIITSVHRDYTDTTIFENLPIVLLSHLTYALIMASLLIGIHILFCFIIGKFTSWQHPS